MSDNIIIRRNIYDSDAIYFLVMVMKKYCPNGTAEFTEEFSQELPDRAALTLRAREDGCTITYVEDDNEKRD